MLFPTRSHGISSVTARKPGANSTDTGRAGIHSDSSISCARLNQVPHGRVKWTNPIAIGTIFIATSRGLGLPMRPGVLCVKRCVGLWARCIGGGRWSSCGRFDDGFFWRWMRIVYHCNQEEVPEVVFFMFLLLFQLGNGSVQTRPPRIQSPREPSRALMANASGCMSMQINPKRILTSRCSQVHQSTRACDSTGLRRRQAPLQTDGTARTRTRQLLAAVRFHGYSRPYTHSARLGQGILGPEIQVKPDS